METREEITTLMLYFKKCLTLINKSYVAKPLIIAILSIIIAYFLPDFTAWIIEENMPDFPGITQQYHFYDYVTMISMGLIFVFSCCISFYGIYGLVRYTLFQKHQGRRKLVLVLVTYMYIIVGFANTYFLISYVGDEYDSLHKFRRYYELSQNQEAKSLMIKEEIHLPNNNALLGIKSKLWSGVDTKEQLQLWNYKFLSEITETLPVSYIFKGVEFTQPQVIRYQPDHKLSAYADCLYFSTITIASVGYGDITPQSALAKFLVCLETIMGQLLLALGIASAYSGISHTTRTARVITQGTHHEKIKNP
ncbi:MAG: Ion transport 2 domain protein [Firmicutes bacterium]|nr:Ion transport 2 domain protein [Bacillota bacterium]